MWHFNKLNIFGNDINRISKTRKRLAWFHLRQWGKKKKRPYFCFPPLLFFFYSLCKHLVWTAVAAQRVGLDSLSESGASGSGWRTDGGAPWSGAKRRRDREENDYNSVVTCEMSNTGHVGFTAEGLEGATVRRERGRLDRSAPNDITVKHVLRSGEEQDVCSRLFSSSLAEPEHLISEFLFIYLFCIINEFQFIWNKIRLRGSHQL